MFEFLFSYPQRVFEKGKFVLMGSWPGWVLACLCLGAAVALAWPLIRGRRDTAVRVRGWRLVVLWGLQALTAVTLLTILWQPALLVSALQPQQNVVAVVVDDSGSMALKDGGSDANASRSAKARAVLTGGMLDALRKQFQVRLYKTGSALERLEKVEALKADARATRLSDSLRTVAAESSSVPIGAIVLLSDGGDNSGGIDLQTLAEIRSRRIPVHTVGFGREKYDRDIEVAAAEVPARALAESRIAAQVTLRQTGFANQKAVITVRDEGRVLAQQAVTFRADGAPQTETVLFNAGVAGPKAVQIAVAPQQGEESAANNQVTRLVTVEKRRPRILYIEGEPKWEYKFIRRAMDEEKTVALSSMVRTTQNKILFQVDDKKGLEDGFPTKAEDLFAYDAVIIGGIEIGYFSSTQQDMLRMFVDRRGGGVLFLGARNGLSDGGWAKSTLVDLLPVSIADRRGTFKRDRAKINLTSSGTDSLITRLNEVPAQNSDRWAKMPELDNFQETGAPKPGAVTLLELTAPGNAKWPLLVTQNYGRGRTALFASSGSWRWQMLQPIEDLTHENFWQQLCRWLVTDTPARVVGTTPRQVLSDEQRVQLRAEVRDKQFLPVNDAKVVARVMAPDGGGAEVEMRPDPFTTGLYTGSWDAEKPGSYVAEVIAKRGEEELGTDIINFRREDGTAENFGTEQNRELLEKLSAQSGGNYYRPDDVGRLAKDISYSEAGITVREAKDLWNMPAVFLALLGMKAVEWLLRRKWGVV